MRTMNQIVLVQETNNVMVHALLSGVARQPIQMIRYVPVGIVIQKDLSSFKTALSGSKKQRRLLL